MCVVRLGLFVVKLLSYLYFQTGHSEAFRVREYSRPDSSNALMMQYVAYSGQQERRNVTGGEMCCTQKK